MKTIRQPTRWLGLALVGGILTLAVSVEAKKPVQPPEPPPPVDAGVIYAQIEGDIHAVNPDGSGQQYLFTPPDGVAAYELVPSHSLHNGERWFVGWQMADGFYLDGVSLRFRLIAMSESGAAVVLYDDILVQPSMGSRSSLRWVPGDDAVSWLAMRWDGDTVVEWGIHRLDVEFNADGSIAVGSPTLVDWTTGLFELWYEAPPSPWLEGYYLLVNNYDWSPDASAIVYSACYSEAFETQLYVADDTGAAVQFTDEDTNPTGPTWSPDGTRIVFQLAGYHQIDVINADGSGRATLIATSRTDDREMVSLPMWSPASTHLVYCYFTAGPRWIWRKSTLHIVAADGSGDTALTGAYTLVHPLGWCAEE